MTKLSILEHKLILNKFKLLKNTSTPSFVCKIPKISAYINLYTCISIHFVNLA